MYWVVVVTQTFARRFFPDVNPIGRTFQLDVPPPQPTYTIIGIVGDTKIRQVREERTGAATTFTSDEAATFLPIAYLAVSQDPTAPPELRIVMRTELSDASLTRELTRTIKGVAPGAAVSYEHVMAFVDDVLVSERLMARLSGFFGALAVLIAAIGLYGVMSYLVSRRRVEIGVRMALGAQPSAVVGMIFGESLKLLLAGTIAGVGPADIILFTSRAFALTLAPLFLWFGFINHTSSERSVRRIVAQGASIALIIMAAILAAGGLIAFYELRSR